MLRVYSPDAMPLLAEYDQFICALGFEERSVHAPVKFSALAKCRRFVEFTDRKVLAYKANKKTLRDLGFVAAKSVNDALDVGDQNTILVDISSMSRPMLAKLVRALGDRTARVDFLYSPSAFTPPIETPPPQTYSGPVIPEYAGWSDKPEAPLAAVLGLGNESGRALGFLEFIEPSVAWLFVPSSRDEPNEQKKYDNSIAASNIDLYSIVPASQVIRYHVSDASHAFEQLEALVYGLDGVARTVLAPFGPKIFALASLLVAELYRPRITVWRVSGEQSETPHPHPALGPVYRCPVQFGLKP